MTRSDTDSDKKPNAGKVRSMQRISEALFSLMREKSFSQISVTELCDAAGLVRKTFYRNFQTKTAIVEYRLDEIFDDIRNRFDADTSAKVMLLYAFERAACDPDFVRIFTDPDLKPVVVDKIRDFVESSFGETLRSTVSFSPPLADFYTTFIADGIISLIRTWERGGKKQSPEVMAELARRLMSGVIA